MARAVADDPARFTASKITGAPRIGVLTAPFAGQVGPVVRDHFHQVLRRLDRRQLPVSSRDGHEPGERARVDLAGLGVLAQRRVGRQRLPPHVPVSGHPVPPAPDLAQGGDPILVKRRDQRVGPGRTNMVLTVARRALPASVLPGLSRSRRPAMSRAAATRFALAVPRHTQSSSCHRPRR